MRARACAALAPVLMTAAVAAAAATAAHARSPEPRPRRDPRADVPHVASGERVPPAAASSVASPARAPETFFVDALAGRDANRGTSPSRPWRTLARVNHGRYVGGDSILLRGGEQFTGALRFSPTNVSATSPQAQLEIGSFGGGVATIEATKHDGIRAVNVAGFHISGIELAGRHTGCRPHSFGILFFAKRAFATLAQGITVEHVDVHGFCDGIAVATGDDNSRFEHVRLTDLSAHDNGDAGVFTFDPALRQHDIRDVYVSAVQAYNNDGVGGIALFGVEGGTVEHSVAHDNGRGGSGGVGIWAFDADHITIQYSESYRNLTPSGDGDGFDLDGGVSNSVMQYDYAHDSQGIGFLVCGCVEEYEMHNDVVRYDVSQNDGTNGQPSGLYVLGGEPFSNLDVFNNSFYSAAGAGTLVLLEAGEGTIAQMHLRNNLLAVGAGKPLLEVPETAAMSGLEIQGNDWWSGTGRFEMRWGTRALSSLPEARAVAGIETVQGKPVGLNVAPEVCALGEGGTVFPSPPGELRAYELRPTSPLIGAGLNLAGLFGMQVGPHDFGGDPVAQEGRFDVGADEHQPGEGC